MSSTDPGRSQQPAKGADPSESKGPLGPAPSDGKWGTWTPVISAGLGSLATIVVGLVPVYLAYLGRGPESKPSPPPDHAAANAPQGASDHPPAEMAINKYRLRVEQVEYFGNGEDAEGHFLIRVQGSKGSYDLSFPEETFKVLHGEMEKGAEFKLPLPEDEYVITILMFEKDKHDILTLAKSMESAPVKPDHDNHLYPLYEQKNLAPDRGVVRAKVRFSVY